MKVYTDLGQSDILAEFLPLESADMYYIYNIPYAIPYKNRLGGATPCWSLAALLDILPYPQLSKDKLGNGKEGWMVSVYPDNCRYDSCWHDNQVDACVDMVIKLNEQKLL